MAIGNTEGVSVDRRGGGVHFHQMRGGQEAATKSDEDSMDLKGDMAAGGSEDSTTEVRESKYKGGREGAERFSACTSGGYTAKIARGGDNRQQRNRLRSQKKRLWRFQGCDGDRNTAGVVIAR